MSFQERLRKLRTEAGETQDKVAHIIGITTRQYQRFENADQKPGFDNLLKLADYFNVSVDWLMGRTEKRDVNR